MNEMPDIPRLRAYLLDQLSEKDVGELELTLLEDDGTYEVLLAVEEELIDDYVHDALTRDEASSFLAYLGRLGDGPARARFARALSSPSRGADRDVRTSPSRRRTAPPHPSRRFAPAAAAALLLVSVVSGTIVWRLSQRVAELEAELAGREAAAAPSEVRSRYPSVVLRAGTLRGPGPMQELALSSEDELVELRLDLPEDSHELYRATLRDADGAELATLSRLRAEVRPSEIHVSFLVPARVLAPGDYYVELEGSGPSSEGATLGRFDFRAIAR